MKIYAVRSGVMVECEVPDGAVYVEIGSQDDGQGGRLAPIHSIDWDRRVLTRGFGLTEEPFPPLSYCESDCAWRPSDDAAATEPTGWRGVWH